MKRAWISSQLVAVAILSIVITRVFFCKRCEFSFDDAPSSSHPLGIITVNNGLEQRNVVHDGSSTSSNGRDGFSAPASMVVEEGGQRWDHDPRIPFPTVPSPPYDTKIPRILHRSWKTENVPQVMRKWTKTCSDLHPDWTHILWTDEMNRELVRVFYPWFLPVYDSYEKNVMRADAARIFYMHKFGGVYMDLDFECIRPMDSLLNVSTSLLGYLSDDYEYEHNIPNAWMASKPRHKFWEFTARLMQFNPYDPALNQSIAEYMTGPVMLYNAYYKWNSKHENSPNSDYRVTILSNDLIYPFDWHSRSPWYNYCWARSSSYSPEKCKKEMNVVGKSSYVVTYWSHSWESIGRSPKASIVRG
ncbi:hypothetical protein SeMB42_g03749 [Synchytrium endobioticum]|uniref:Alpha 1,4-glycosyltransferase domain-containing protein n=1 Tax=Synchytrium endobioticum TaxID=286115 RepID=A0A507CSP4_9FUNG|nr:hypothetical protein SeLEV6574_g05733 [Synchytrium endobioticum]TPX46302.1 hypothetical protein SeMB42_g03749 [Synchytrium endobioticum]